MTRLGCFLWISGNNFSIIVLGIAFIEITVGIIGLVQEQFLINFLGGQLRWTDILITIPPFISIFLGVGILLRKKLAWRLLVLFSIFVLVGKVLIYAGIPLFFSINIGFIPIEIKDTISILYHAFIILLFGYMWICKEFQNRNLLF